MVDEVCVDLGQSGALDEVVELAHSSTSRQLRQRGVQVVLLRLEQPPLLVVGQRLVPERPNEDAGDFGRVNDLAQVPHQRAVDPHQLWCRTPIRLVQDDVDLVVVASGGVDDPLELVRNVKLRDIEEQQYHVHPLREPLDHGLEFVASLNALLLPGQDARRVYQRDPLQHRARQAGTLEAAQERVAEVAELREGQGLVDDQGVAGRGAVGLSVRHAHKLVGCRLRPYSQARVVPLQQVPDEGALPRRILPHEQHHRDGGEVRIGELRGIELVEVVLLLDGQQLLFVQPLQALRDGAIHLGVFLLLTPTCQPLEHGLRPSARAVGEARQAEGGDGDAS
mmetsp:Transcript_39167/g.111064  ORF Transcript_39167/g.111064 Transcript_39167/m.111064 type:complete len:337 (+) Transcript_39167:763-1773(+)